MKCISILLTVVFSVLVGKPSVAQEWEYFGPKSNHYQYKGLIQSIWFDKDNLDYVLAGSASAGLFRTYNAKDSIPNWINITQSISEYNYGISGIVVDKENKREIIYIATRSIGGVIGGSLGNGIYVTYDGGNSWQNIGPRGVTKFDFPLLGIKSSERNKGKMLAFKERNLYKTQDGWDSWIETKLPFDVDSKSEISDVYFDPFDDNTIYLCTKVYLSKTSAIYKSNDFGNTWSDITPEHIKAERIALDFNYSKKNCFYLAFGTHDFNLTYFNGEKYSAPLLNIPLQQIAGSAYWCFEFGVDKKDTNNIIVASTEISMSRDGGKTFRKIGYYNGLNTHADVRDLQLENTDEGLITVVANDGGVSSGKGFGKIQTNYFQNLNGEGLYANQFWGISTMNSGNEIIAGGAQDNGHFIMSEKEEMNNVNACGDGYLSFVINDTLSINECNPPFLLLQNHKTKRITHLKVNDQNMEARRPIISLDSTIYIGYHDVWKIKVGDILKGNTTFSNVSSIPIFSNEKGVQNREIKAMTINKFGQCLIAYSNPNYDSKENNGKIFFCMNLQSKKPDFIDITSKVANEKLELARWWTPESFAAHPNRKNIFYLIYRDPFVFTNSNVYQLEYLPDSNQVNLTDITYNLPKVGYNKIVVDNSVNELYVLSNDGLFHMNVADIDTVWKRIAFPHKVPLSDIVFNEHLARTYIATFGYGIWQGPLLSFNNTSVIIKKSQTFNNVYRIDGVLKIKRKRRLKIKSDLVITTGSKIILGNKSILEISKESSVINQYGKKISIEDFVEKSKKSKLIIND
ncbi:MAG: WD40/YVTN/BNR-like repeat-containing protein [Bacteroidia bacterium]